MSQEILSAILETLLMTFLPGIIAVIFGGTLGSILYIINSASYFPAQKNKFLYQFLSIVINIMRSLPFVILMIFLIPLTRLLVGTSIGTLAACVPLSLASIPFFARIFETSLLEVNSGLIEAGISMGASNLQILFKIIIPEAQKSIISGITLMIISLISYTAMAGVIGGGGLGAIAYNYGYLRFDNYIMAITVLLIIILVQAVQSISDFILNRKYEKNS